MSNDPFKHDVYAPNRTRIMTAYVDQQVAYLQTRFPDQSEERLRAFARKVVESNIKRPTADVLVHPEAGVTQRKQLDLLTHLNLLQDNIITPSGSVYCPPQKKESLIKASLDENVKGRKINKTKMLEYAEQGDKVRAQIYNFLQASNKIFNNSVPGAMGSQYNCLYDLPGYNAVTSTARHSVRSGYAHVEKLLEGNLYITCPEDVINYCVNHQRNRPNTVRLVMLRYNLYQPTADDLFEHFATSLAYYTNVRAIAGQIKSYLQMLSQDDLAFIFYAGCLRNLVRKNDSLFRSFFQDFFTTDLPIDEDLKSKEGHELMGSVYKIEKDLFAMVSSLNYDQIKRKKLEDAVTQEADGVRKMVTIGRHMNASIEKTRDLFETFFRVDVDVAQTVHYPNIVRKAVLVSDTDSVIFSTQSMVEWYAGAANFTRQAYEINAFSVYLISRTLEHVFARLSVGFGMSGSDINLICMKNEFLYPLLMRTPLAKHYAGWITIQEGKILPEPKKDIKGINFRGSDLCSETNDGAEAFLTWMMTTVMKDNSLSISECMAKVVEHERTVYNSIIAGKRDFLGMASVKPKEEYKDPMQSDYFYYMFWTDVFAETFGEFQLPNKGLELNVLGGGKALKEPAWLERLQQFDPKAHERLLNFFERYPKKKVTRIILPPTLKEIPAIFQPVIDLRNIIFRNGRPFYLTLRSLGIGNNFVKGEYIASDFYDTEGMVIPL